MQESFLGIILGVLVVLLCGVSWLLSQRWMAARKGMFLQRAIEIESLKASMKAAIHTLKITKWGMTYTGQAAFYALPWYIVIGPAAAGKSTFLRQSGLHFPFTTREELGVKGFGGTRQCDWWFSDKAIFLDTAGRYTTEEVDHPEWMAFLDTLRQYRCPQPIHGILMVVPLTDIIGASREKLIQQVHIIRIRLEEINKKLGFKVPAILVLTKFDLIPGFEAFFKALPTLPRQQVFGLNFLEEDTLENRQALTQGKLEALYAKLSLWRTNTLNQESALSVADRVLIMDFPEQFRLSMTPILNFMRQLQKDDLNHQMPLIRGLYFTSATYRTYFIQHFFEKILWPLRRQTTLRVVYPQWFWIKQSAWVGLLLIVVSVGNWFF